MIPAERGYKYVANRDEIDTLTRPEKEIKDRYARLIAQVAIRTVHEILVSVPAEVAAIVTFYGHVSTTDLATGQPIRPCLISVSAEREVFASFVLANLDPVACLRMLGMLDDGQPAPNGTADQDLYFPCCFREASEIRRVTGGQER